MELLKESCTASHQRYYWRSTLAMVVAFSWLVSCPLVCTAFTPCIPSSSSRQSPPTVLLAVERSDRGNEKPTARRDQGPRRNHSNFNPAIQLNKEIIELGKQGKWNEILALYQKEGSRFNNVNYATTMTQLARIRAVNRRDKVFLQFVDDLANNIEAKGLDWIGVRAIGNILHAVGKMALRSKSTAKIMDFANQKETAKAIVAMGNPQEVANICWGMAKTGDSGKYIIYFQTVEKQAAWLAKEGTPQAIANTAWACATLGFQSPMLFAEIEKQAAWLVKEGNPQNAANTAWACGTLGFQSPLLFAEIEKQATWLVKEGTPQAVANTACACAKLGFQSPLLFAEIEKEAACLVKEGTPQNVANTAWACGTLGFQSPKLFAEIEKQAGWLVKEGTPQNVANTAWACATLGYSSELFFGCLSDNISKLTESSNAQEIINTCYAVAILDLALKYENEFRQLWAAAICLDSTTLSAADSNQLYQVFAFSKAQGIHIPAPSITFGMDADLIDNSPSRSQNEISSILRSLGFDHDEEVPPWILNDESSMTALPPGMLAIDMACRQKMIAVEFDGPSHFLRQVGSGKVLDLENGATKAKRRFLERLGWKVINIPYFVWMKAKGEKEKKELLCKLLDLPSEEED